MGYSLGVPCVLGYALQRPAGLIGIILGDYPARYPALPSDWVESVVAANPGRARHDLARALQRDSREVPLWDALPLIDVPVLVLRGAQPGALLTAEAADRYQQALRNVRVVVLEDSGHELWRPEYIRTLREFLEALDGASRAAW
jgi:pimeloyl-ACP methyl ester carboxylesterase